MSNVLDIKKADPADAAAMAVLDAWATRTEQREIRLPRDGSVWAIWRGQTVVAVYVFHVEPCVAMFFDREGPAMQTIRAFDLIRAVMQANGVSPLVFVEDKSPLHEISGKRMTEIKDRSVYRMM